MNDKSDGNMPAKGRKKSGQARMAGMTPEERSAFAARAAEKRWSRDVAAISACCGSEDDPLMIGDIAIPCFVLDDDRRVITLTGMQNALGMGTSGGAPRLAEFIGRIDPNSANANELAVRLSLPIKFTPPRGGKPVYGYEGSLLADICESILESRQQGRLTSRHEAIAARAELLMRGFARVGIVALIDEKTGYQYFRARKNLAEIISRYISEKLTPWTKRFPDEYYLEMFRLKGWDFSNLVPGGHKPQVVASA